jgi:RNA polymerase sigma-70 factor (ECF subfamily)
VGVAPTQPVVTAVQGELAPVVPCDVPGMRDQETEAPAEVKVAVITQPGIATDLLDELWQTCEAETCGLTRTEFDSIVLRIGLAGNFGVQSGMAAQATKEQQAAFFRSLRMADLVLARACAGGNERAWERFIALYRQPLLRAGAAIASNEAVGRELADGLYAELYGLTVREGERRCPLDSYSGRGSLIGWLRTTLAQRYVDQHRRTHREQPLNEVNQRAAPHAGSATAPDSTALSLLTGAINEALERQATAERLLLASYYLDGRRLHEIATMMGVHEATVSRKLRRAAKAVRKQIVRSLERKGLSRRQAEEALATDPRDLTSDLGGVSSTQLRVKELLQSSPRDPFKEQAEP